MDKQKIEKLFERSAPFEIPDLPDVMQKIPEEPRQRKVHSKSSVAAPSADYIMYKELRHRQIVTDQLEKKLSLKEQQQSVFDKKRQDLMDQDALKTEKRRLKRLKKKKNKADNK